EYCQLIDDLDFSGLAECFTSDAAMEAFGRHKSGRDDVVAFLGKVITPQTRGKHLVTNTIVETCDAGRADVTSDFLFVDAAAKVITGRYVDEFAREDARWRIANRHPIPTPSASPA